MDEGEVTQRGPVSTSPRLGEVENCLPLRVV